MSAVATAARLGSARTRLGWALVRRALDEEPSANVFISPHSLGGALAVAQAAGVVEAESIGELLGSDAPGEHALLAAELDDPDPEAVELHMAQSLWTDPRLGTARADAVGEHFPAIEWRVRAFSDPATVAEMNAWASEQTGGRIKEVVKVLTPDEVLAVLDAILFEGTWQHPFDPARTRPAPFTTGAGTTVELPLMELSAKAAYREGDGWRAVRLNYGWGRLGLLVVLGPAGESLASLAGRLDWREVADGLSSRSGVVRLPRFRADATASLLDHLKALGLGPPRDRPLLEDDLLSISRVEQRAVLEVDEEGTRASAVTFLAAELTSLGPPPFDFTADRPFLCAIHDRDTGSLLFVGAIQDPEPITE